MPASGRVVRLPDKCLLGRESTFPRDSVLKALGATMSIHGKSRPVLCLSDCGSSSFTALGHFFRDNLYRRTLRKPIHQICGFVYLPSGDRIPNAEVTVLQAGNEIAVQQTSKDGKFSFEQLRPGKYEIRVRVEHFADAHSQVVLVNPKARPKEELAVLISLSGACSNISLVHTK
jgi:hypothetical protein